MNVLLKDLLKAFEYETKLGLCTLLDVQGSSPQVPGASVLFSCQGVLAGTVGGGFVEESCRSVVNEIIVAGTSRLITCDLSGTYHQKGAAVCGGQAKVLIDGGVNRYVEIFRKVLSSLEKREAGVLLTLGHGGEGQRLKIERRMIQFSEGRTSLSLPEWSLEIPQIKEIGVRPQFIEGCLKDQSNKGQGQTWIFVQPFYPAPRLLIFGGGHVGHAVAKMGQLLDFEVTVVDNRKEFSSRERFPNVSSIQVKDYGQLPDKLQPNSDTFVVIVTQGHRHDAEVLRHFISSEVAYLGMIGSHRKVKTVRAEFLKKGWATALEWEKVHAPIGLEIGAETVGEIGVSIAAELVHARRKFEQSLELTL